MDALVASRWPRTACLVFCLGWGLAVAGSKPADDTPDSGPASSHHYKVIHAFAGVDGESPSQELLLGSDGLIYGTTWHGGSNSGGVIYRLGRAGGAFEVVHDFVDRALGAGPSSGLIEASDGNFYGVTMNGGPHNVGVVYRLTLGGTYSVMHEFFITGSGGYFPWGRLMQASDGKIYGTTTSGGRNYGGTVFRMDLSGAFEIVWNMGGDREAHSPYAGLIQASDGRLYGTSAYGGEFGKGTVFSVGLDGSHALLHSFNGSDGEQLQAGVVQGSDSSLYGTALSGGRQGRGVVYRLTMGGTLTVLHEFGSTTLMTGFWPQGALLEARDGVFLGAAPYEGLYTGGTLFQVRANGRFKMLHQFPDPHVAEIDGSAPSGVLLALPDGEYVGTTGSGGAHTRGTVYRLRLK